MKNLTILTALLFLLSLVAVAFAETPLTRIRIVNLSALGVQKELTDEELVELANIEISENPRIFPDVANFVIKVNEKVFKYSPDAGIPVGELTFSGSMKEEEMLEFISLFNHDKVGKFDIAVVKKDRTVVKIDREVVIDYKKRSMKTFEPITVEDGDVVFAFVRDVSIIDFPDDKENTSGSRSGSTPGSGRTGGTGGTGGARP
jgi:hypothetical protein